MEPAEPDPGPAPTCQAGRVRLGVLSDIHGNRTALEAVVADGAARGVDTWWALGDLVAIGPDPIGALDVLTSLPNLVATRGNTERYVLTGERPPPTAADVRDDPSLLELFASVEGSFSWTRSALATAGRLDWIAALPLETRIVLDDGTRVLGVHASPGRDDGAGITPDRSDEELRAALAGAEADLVLAGHTHQATDRHVAGVRAVNLGSVSNPVTDDRSATYVIVESDGDGHRLVHARVPYDHETFLQIVAASGHPEHEYIASYQRGEQTRFRAIRPGAPVRETLG
jgi:predicted phosphodiesterase